MNGINQKLTIFAINIKISNPNIAADLDWKAGIFFLVFKKFIKFDL
jgi:hypothetical protein